MRATKINEFIKEFIKNMKKFFGTDGIRGEFGVEPLTNEFFTILGLAIGRSLLASNNCKKKVIISNLICIEFLGICSNLLSKQVFHLLGLTSI